ncbi:hypothetical protein COY23_02750 [bacterium (Candidatus Torokbacteria) CG_4_10_14_0_2_um_filter_35_8]|nr:MAG: hypothetical protein COY23_02750 [bacterium (Candidatus Torokbacteria) CG_4_10_14_0_2_um_filter_35_8]
MPKLKKTSWINLAGFFLLFVALNFLVVNKVEATIEPEAADINIVRIFGEDRYETAKEISKSMYGSATSAVVATGENYPDALAGIALADYLSAPLLLTPTNSLSPQVTEELTRLSVSDVYILGGEGAISKNIENALINQGYNITRIAGIDRFDTAVKITEIIYSPESVTNIFVVTGVNFPDALSASVPARRSNAPLVLVQGNSLSSSTLEFIGKLTNLSTVFIVGGESVVSSGIKNILEGYATDVIRYSGKNRYATSKSLASSFFNAQELSNLVFATGEIFPDALASGTLGIKLESPMFLTRSNSLPQEISSYLPDCPSVTDVKIIGGEGAVSDNVKNSIEAILRSSAALPAPILSDPGVSAVSNTSYILTWDLIPNAESYNLEEDTDPNFGNPVNFGPITNTHNTISGHYTVLNKMYYYRVRAYNAHGFGPWSNITDMQITRPATPITINVPTDVGSISDALSVSLSGDTIHIEAGTYYENYLYMKDGVTIEGESPSTTIIDGQGNTPFLFTTPNAGDPKITTSISNLTVTNGGYGIYACYSVDLTITNCVFTNCSYGIGADAGSIVLIENNTIVGSALSGVRIDDTATVTATNNIITGSALHGFQCDGWVPAVPTFNYNDVWNNAGGDYFGCAVSITDITADPLYLDAAYHLDPNSPCKNAGDPLSDYSNEPAPNGNRINMGAYGNTPEAVS